MSAHIKRRGDSNNVSVHDLKAAEFESASRPRNPSGHNDVGRANDSNAVRAVKSRVMDISCKTSGPPRLMFTIVLRFKMLLWILCCWADAKHVTTQSQEKHAR